jgi:hypothetical protein
MQSVRDALIVFMTRDLSVTDWGCRLQRVHWEGLAETDHVAMRNNYMRCTNSP